MANDVIRNPGEKGQKRESGTVKCLICGSDSTTVSGRQGMEKITKYFYPKAPYRCKECWGRFWVPDNPLKYTGTKVLIGCAVLLLLLAAVILIFTGGNQETGGRVASRKIDRPPAAGPEKVPPAETPASAEPGIATVTEAVPVPPPPAPSSEMPPTASSASMESQPSSSRESSEPESAEPVPVSEGTDEAFSSPSPGEKQIAALQPEPASPADAAEKTPTPAAADLQDSSLPPAAAPSATDAGTTAGGGEAQAFDQSVSAETASQDSEREMPESEDTGKSRSESEKQTEKKQPVPSAVAHKTKKKGALEKKKVRELTFIETGASDESVRLHIHGGGPIRTHRFFYMKSPSRLVIDLPGAWKHRGDSVYPLESVLAERVRVGGHADFIRAVIDLKVAGPVHPAFTETEKGLVVEVRK